MRSPRIAYRPGVERRWVEVARVFGVLGATAFGGPAAHVALMREELVRRRGWEDEQTFVDLVGLTALLPGPNSTELAIELGRRRAGTTGLVAAGVAFVAPAALIVGVLAWVYEHQGATPEADYLRDGVLPVVLAIVVSAVWQLGRTAVTGTLTGLVAAGALGAQVAGADELVVLAAGALATTLWAQRRRLGSGARGLVVVLAAAPAAGGRAVRAVAGGRAVRAAAAAVATGTGTLVGGTADTGTIGLGRLFWSFLRIGATLFGSGYVLVAFVQAEFVDRLGVLTPTQVLDAVSIGQITPGPLFSTATFVGYLLGGPAGAAVATVAIFLPAFLLVAALGRVVEPLLRRPGARVVLDGLNAAAVGLIAAVAVDLADDALGGPFGAGLAVAALAVLVRTRLNPSWLVLAGALAGLARAAVR